MELPNHPPTHAANPVTIAQSPVTPTLTPQSSTLTGRTRFKHCAVLVAEEIDGRLQNLLNMFHHHIPLIVIEVKGLVFDDRVTLLFSTVLEEYWEFQEAEKTQSVPGPD